MKSLRGTLCVFVIVPTLLLTTACAERNDSIQLTKTSADTEIEKYLAERDQEAQHIINEYLNDQAFVHFTHEDAGLIKYGYLLLKIDKLLQIDRIDFAIKETIKSINEDIMPTYVLFFTLAILYLCNDQFQESLNAIENYIAALDKRELGECEEKLRAAARYIALFVFIHSNEFDNALAMFRDIQSSAFYNSLSPNEIASLNGFEEYFSNPFGLYKFVVEKQPRPIINTRIVDEKSETVSISFVLSGRFELDYDFAKQNSINVDNLPKTIPIAVENIGQ